MNKNISKKDLKLLQKAWELSYTKWYLIDQLINMADSEDTKKNLKAIQSSKYHREEYSAGVL